MYPIYKEQTGSDSSSVLISEISGKKSSPALDSGPSPLDSTHGLRAGEFFAVKDVSFELRRGELRTLGRSEKEISEKCLGATKGPDSGRRRHQCLGLIGHNGAGNQAAGQPLVRLPQAARRVRRRGKARINMTLLKMLNGLIKPDAGTITMRGRVASWSMQKTPQANGAHFRSTLGSGRSTPLPINGSVLGLTKKEPERRAARGKGAVGRPAGLRGLGNRKPNRRQDRRDHRLCRDSGIHRHAGAELFIGHAGPLGVRRCHGARSRCVDC